MFLYLLIFCLISSAISAELPLKTEYQWKYFDYIWKSSEQKQNAIESGDYDFKLMTPIDVDQAPDGRIFVTIISRKGVPATLNTVSEESGEGGRLLQPYPDWSWYENKNKCTGITNVYRVAIDSCNRLWVLDTGKTQDDITCPMQLLQFDLKTDKLIKQIEIPSDIAEKDEELLLVTPIVETYGPNCDNTTVYMADVEGSGLVVWNGEQLYRVQEYVFRSEEKHAIFEIAGGEFYLPDGVLGMALSPVLGPNKKRYLSFRPLASKSLYAADTRVLLPDFDVTKIEYQGIDILPSQAVAQAFSSDGTLFYGLTSEIAIGCWNINKPLDPKYLGIAVRDEARLQFTSGMKVISTEQEEQLLMLSNRLQKVYANTISFDEINFRILRASVPYLTKGTICESS